MASDKTKMLLVLSLTGSLLAFGLAFLVFKLLHSGTRHFNSVENLYYGIFAATSACISIQIMWRLMFHRKPITKQRGIKYGSLAGTLAVYVMMNLITFYEMMPLRGDDSVLALILTPIGMSIFALIAGGFLAPIIGAIMGYYSVLLLENDR